MPKTCSLCTAAVLSVSAAHTFDMSSVAPAFEVPQPSFVTPCTCFLLHWLLGWPSSVLFLPLHTLPPPAEQLYAAQRVVRHHRSPKRLLCTLWSEQMLPLSGHSSHRGSQTAYEAQIVRLGPQLR